MTDHNTETGFWRGFQQGIAKIEQAVILTTLGLFACLYAIGLGVLLLGLVVVAVRTVRKTAAHVGATNNSS